MYEALLNKTLDVYDWFAQWEIICVVAKYGGALIAGGIITIVFGVAILELVRFIALHTN